MHLFVSFMLRAVSIFIKDRVMPGSGGLQELDTALMDNLKTISIVPLDKSQYVRSTPQAWGGGGGRDRERDRGRGGRREGGTEKMRKEKVKDRMKDDRKRYKAGIPTMTTTDTRQQKKCVRSPTENEQGPRIQNQITTVLFNSFSYSFHILLFCTKSYYLILFRDICGHVR